MSIETQLVEDLAPLGIPVFQQGDWTGGELPPEFVTYFPVDSTDLKHYANRPAYVEEQVQVNVYTEDPSRLEPLRKQVSSLLLQAHWTRDGRGYAGELEDKTGRFPWFMVFYRFEKEVL